METNTANDNTIKDEVDKTLLDMNNIRDRLENYSVSRREQFEIAERCAQNNTSPHEQQEFYHGQRQAMGEIWKERDEQFRNDMDELER